jgi:hypothetical protein
LTLLNVNNVARVKVLQPVCVARHAIEEKNSDFKLRRAIAISLAHGAYKIAVKASLWNPGFQRMGDVRQAWASHFFNLEMEKKMRKLTSTELQHVYGGSKPKCGKSESKSKSHSHSHASKSKSNSHACKCRSAS